MNTKYLKLSLVVFPTMAVVLFAFNNCGRYGSLNDSGSYSASSLGPEEELNSEKLGLPYALLSAEQTYASMMRVTNQTTATTALTNEYNNRYGALAAGNDLSMANGPLMLGSTSLAGEVCNTLLTQEKAMADGSRNFFNGINFNTGGVKGISDASFASSVRGLARSFWGRNETNDELMLLSGYKTEFIAALAATATTQAASASNMMLATCAAMLSSVDAITY